MKTYRYEAVDGSGHQVRGSVPSESAALAVDLLGKRGLIATRVAENRTARMRLSRKDLAMFFQGTATLVEAGVPLDGALGMQQDNRRISAFACSVRDRLAEGETLFAAVDAAGPIPDTIRGLLQAGERTGLLSALHHSAATLERDNEVRSEVWSALAYPLVLLVVGLGAAAALAFGMLPRFASLLTETGNTLPLTTQALLTAAAFLRDHAVLVALTGLGVAVAGLYWMETAAGRRFLLRMPVVGELRLSLATARAARALGALLEVGAPVIDAVTAAAEAAADGGLQERFDRVAAHLRSGVSLGAALGREHAMTAQAVSLVRIGERSGETATMLGRAAILADARAMRGLRTLVSLLEPAMILMLGGLIGFIALAVLQAIYGIGIGG